MRSVADVTRSTTTNRTCLAKGILDGRPLNADSATHVTLDGVAAESIGELHAWCARRGSFVLIISSGTKTGALAVDTSQGCEQVLRRDSLWQWVFDISSSIKV